MGWIGLMVERIKWVEMAELVSMVGWVGLVENLFKWLSGLSG